MRKLLKPVAQGVVHTAVMLLERRLLARWGGPSAMPHIFVIGAPRSGTSLFYELLVTRFRLAYFSNMAHRFYRTPVAVSLLGRPVIARWRGLYRSDYGHIGGWGAPNEGGWIWRRWLADGPWQDETALCALPTEEIRRTLNAMSRLFAAPFVNKNVMHSNRVRLLDALFPGCLFIEVTRDPVDTARSIIRAQQRQRGPRPRDDNWWSVRPSLAADCSDSDPISRACAQVAGVARDIERDIGPIGHDRHLRIGYEETCAAPRATLDIVHAFLARHGMELEERLEVPSRFDSPLAKPLAAAEEEEIRRGLDRFA